MKNIITILIIACCFIVSAQSPTEKYGYPYLGVRSESAVMVGATFKNTNLAEKAGIVFIVGNDTGWVWIDTLTGYFNFYPALVNQVGVWTGNGTNVYLRDSTDNVGIGVSNPGGAKLRISHGTLNTLGGLLAIFDSTNAHIQIGDSYMDILAAQVGIGSSGSGVMAIPNKVIIQFTDSVIFQKNDTIMVIDENQVSFSKNINAPLLPTDSTLAASKDFWVDINGFIRRKF